MIPVNGKNGAAPIQVSIVATQALFRASLARFLESEHSLRVVDHHGDFTQAAEGLISNGIDVVLLDADEAAESRDRFMGLARSQGYSGRFLVVTGVNDPAGEIRTMKQGASGIFLKSEAPERLIEAIRIVAQGGVWLSQETLRGYLEGTFEAAQAAKNHFFGADLTEREQKVLSGILGGLTNKKIGESLGISEGTVKTSVQQLFYRAHVRRRSQLVRAAMESRLIERLAV